MVRYAMVCADGIGDALILEIISHHLRLKGHEVVTFSHHLGGFGAWLPKAVCLPHPEKEEMEKVFGGFDVIVVQHDNTRRAQGILGLREKREVYCLYTNYRMRKHGPMKEGYDIPFNEGCSMVENIKIAAEKLLDIDASSGDNGLQVPEGLVHRKHKKRVVIHPTSAMKNKNWPKKKFLQVVKWLEKEGYEPVFVTSPKERAEWNSVDLPTLADLASFLYESGAFLGNDSGPGHLASYLKIPYLIIGRQEKQMKLWRPGWNPGTIITPPKWILNVKGCRLRDEKWQLFISSKKVIKLLQKNVL
ncbi:MAG: hypothetical protein K2X08_00445 [Chlamydiales bacterium]|nr:hypothetical protein [Chlamydiales bacterium]